MKKRLLSTLLALCMAMTLCIPANAFDAANPAPNIIAAASNHAGMVDENGVLWMWGDNTYGQLGNGGSVGTNTPVKIMDGVVSVSASEFGQANMPSTMTTAAIKSDGSLWTWGVVDSDIVPGILGSSTGGNSFVEEETMLGLSQIPIQTEPVKILENVVSVSLGGWSALAIQKDGSLWTWGNMSYDESDSKVPVKVMDGVVSACAGPESIAAIKTDGSLWMWGYDLQDYDDDWSPSQPPIKVMEDVAEVSIGYVGMSYTPAYFAAVKKDGSLWMWGADEGELGLPEQEYGVNSTPVKMMDGVAHVSAGWYHIAAVKTDGSLWTWGDNSFGELGNGTLESSVTPVKVMDDVAAVSAGTGFTLAVKNDGTVWSWGINSSGKLGNGGTGNVTTDYGTVCQTVPAQIPGLKAKTAQSTQPTRPTAPDQPVFVSPTNDKLEVDGTLQSPAAYKINDYNYFKLRDIAALLNGTGKQFSVDYDSSTGGVTLTSGQPYTVTPSDLAGLPAESRQATASANVIYINGEGTRLTVYNVDGYNYFKLRDLASALDFSVGWTAERGMFLESDKPYSA